jgi:S-adenosylhomocysteine hydrolase
MMNEQNETKQINIPKEQTQYRRFVAMLPKELHKNIARIAIDEEKKNLADVLAIMYEAYQQVKSVAA